MKTIFTLLSSLLVSASVLAADAKPKSMITVKSLDEGDISVVLDGRRFEPGFSSVIIQGIDAGFHTVKIYRERFNGPFGLFGSKYEMVYSTSLAVRPRTNLSITVDR